MRSKFGIIGFLLVFGPSLVWADCEIKATPTTPSDAMAILTHNSLFRCLGNPAVDDAFITQDIKKLTPKNVTLQEQQAGVIQSLVALQKHAAELAKTAPDGDDWKNLVQEIDRIAMSLAKIPSDQSIEDYTSNVDTSFTDQWGKVLDYNPNLDLDIVLNSHPINPFRPISQCSADKCTDYIYRLDLVRVIRLMSRVQSYAKQDSLKAQLNVADREVKRWEAYRAKALHQYPWEVALNGWAMDRDKDLNPCPPRPISHVKH